MDINVKISCPDLALAAAALAKALMRQDSTPDKDLSIPVTAAPAPETAAAPTTAGAPSVCPVTPTPQAAAIAPSPVAVPTATAPQITLEQIGKAGADLLNKDPGAMPKLTELLQKYGVSTVQQINPEQFGAFAAELRRLGATI